MTITNIEVIVTNHICNYHFNVGNYHLNVGNYHLNKMKMWRYVPKPKKSSNLHNSVENFVVVFTIQGSFVFAIKL